jgi:tetratricopeptide (TPR) repeat protein
MKWCFAALVVCLSLTAHASSDEELIRQGEVHEQSRMWDVAVRRYNDALQLNPLSESGYLHLGSLRVNTGDLREAVRVYTVGLEHVPASRPLIRARAKTLVVLKQYDDAVVDYRSLGDDDIEVLKELAATYRKTQQTLGELAVWRRIAGRTAGAEQEQARVMVKALQALAGELDVVSNPLCERELRCAQVRALASSVARDRIP